MDIKELKLSVQSQTSDGGSIEFGIQSGEATIEMKTGDRKDARVSTEDLKRVLKIIISCLEQ